jgi:hypothetical protein
MIIVAGGLTVAASASETAVAATPASACAASTVIEITSFAFTPPSVTPGHSSTANLTALNCTAQSQQTSEIWSGRYVGSSGGTNPPPGCPIIDPISMAVDFAPHTAVTTSLTYAVPLTCTATDLIVTVNIFGKNGTLLATGTATLVIA